MRLIISGLLIFCGLSANGNTYCNDFVQGHGGKDIGSVSESGKFSQGWPTSKILKDNHGGSDKLSFISIGSDTNYSTLEFEYYNGKCIPISVKRREEGYHTTDWDLKDCSKMNNAELIADIRKGQLTQKQFTKIFPNQKDLFKKYGEDEVDKDSVNFVAAIIVDRCKNPMVKRLLKDANVKNFLASEIVAKKTPITPRGTR